MEAPLRCDQTILSTYVSLSNPRMQIGINIVDDNQWEPDEEFFVKLNLIPNECDDVKLGRTSIMEITILNDDGNPSQNQWCSFTGCLLLIDRC